MALNFPAANGFWSSISALNEDILVHNLLLSHVPDGRWLDSEMLLQEVENIMRIVLENEVSGPPMGSETQHRISNIEIVESTETLPYAISRISLPMLCPSTGEKDLETRTMVLFDLLQNYRWDAKVVIVLGALAATYGGLWLPKHLSSSDPVAASVATLSWLPFNRSKFSPWLKSLSLLVKAMLDVTKCIITFERLPVRHAKPDKNVVGETMSQVHLAAYWVVRSALACLLQIHDFKQSQQVHASDSRIAMRELSSLGYRMINIQIRIEKQVEECRQQIEEEIYQKLHSLFAEIHKDNQEVLQLLFSLQDDFPIQDFSRQQISITELKNKVTLLLLAKPELLPLEQLPFLLQQTYYHPSNVEKERKYDIIWIPIPLSTRWAEEEKGIFEFFSNSLPWCSVRRPWLMSSTVVKFMRTEWNYRDDEAMMIVLDLNGRIVNMNAMDMVLIWGVRAYPFSIAREDELWEEDGWSMQLLLDSIHPAFEKWVEEKRDVCIYGSDDSNWVNEFKSRARNIRNLGFQFELIYLGKRDRAEHTKTNPSAMNGASIELCSTMQQFFWLRLESIRRSRLRRGSSPQSDRVLAEVSELLDFDYDEHKGWAVIGKGPAATAEDDIIRLSGRKVMECLRRIHRWRLNAAELSFHRAVKVAGEAEERPCDETHTVVAPFEDGSTTKRVVTCDKCKRPMMKSVIYQ